MNNIGKNYVFRMYNGSENIYFSNCIVLEQSENKTWIVFPEYVDYSFKDKTQPNLDIFNVFSVKHLDNFSFPYVNPNIMFDENNDKTNYDFCNYLITFSKESQISKSNLYELINTLNLQLLFQI